MAEVVIALESLYGVSTGIDASKLTELTNVFERLSGWPTPKDKPLVGLVILRNLKQNPDEPGLWEGGDITDPKNGKTYRARLKPVDGGKKLEVRGYIGPIYRTQTWMRVE